MPQQETYRNTLRQALAIAGDEGALSARLKVTTAKVKDWITGVEPVPDHVFLEAVDMVLTATTDEQARSRKAIREPPSGKAR